MCLHPVILTATAVVMLSNSQLRKIELTFYIKKIKTLAKSLHKLTELVPTVLLTTDFDALLPSELSSVLAPQLQGCAISVHLFYYENLNTTSTATVTRIIY